AGIRHWLQRALQLDARSSFPSAIEARVEFERVLADSGHEASPESLDAFMKRYHASETHAEPPVASPVKPAVSLRIVSPLVPSAAPPGAAAAVAAAAASSALPAKLLTIPSVPETPPVVQRPSTAVSGAARVPASASASTPPVLEEQEAKADVDKPTLSEALSDSHTTGPTIVSARPAPRRPA